MRYLCLLIGEPDTEGPVPGTPEFMQMLADYQSATKAMADAGVLVDSGPLQPPGAATTIRVRNGETLLTDGPFAEIKESLVGYWVIEADEERALQIASRVVGYTEYPMEVRRIMDHSAQP